MDASGSESPTTPRTSWTRSCFVDLPEPETRVQQGQPFGEIESTKTVNDLVAPVSGAVVERNEALQGDPESVNRDPYGQGWMIVVAPGARNDTANITPESATPSSPAQDHRRGDCRRRSARADRDRRHD